MEKGNCCFCLSTQTGGTLIGISICSYFLHNLLCAIFLQEIFIYSAVNTWLYGAVSFVFIYHNFKSGKEFVFSSKHYFMSFLVFIYVGGNAWNFVFWYCMPETLAKSCKQNNECIDRYQSYGFYCWLGGAIVTSYFAFILREYKARLFASQDQIESARLEKKIEELELLKNAHARVFME